jgi:hypothetical protein
MKFLFCPKCHRRILPPKFLFTANIKAEKGINLACGYKPCTGKVKFKPEFKEDDNTV